jgi:hypothetical protein
MKTPDEPTLDFNDPRWRCARGDHKGSSMPERLEDRVREAVSILTAVRDSLASEAGDEAHEESALQSTVGCVVVDALDPAIRDLTLALEQPPGVPQIRRATLEDLSQIYPTMAAAPEFARTPGILPLPEDLEIALRRPHEVMLTATHGEELAGFLYAVSETSIAATIRVLYTLPQFRGGGIARSLLARCTAILSDELDIKEIGAFVAEGTALDPFLVAQGFRRGSSYVWFSKDLVDAEPIEEIDSV